MALSFYNRQDIFSTFVEDGKIGLMDKSRKQVIPPVYDSIEHFDAQYVRVTRNKKVGLVDIEGRECVPCKYQEIRSPFERYIPYISVLQDGLWGVATKTGIMVIPCRYDTNPSYVFQRYAIVSNDGYKGIIDLKTGITLVDCVLSDIVYSTIGTSFTIDYVAGKITDTGLYSVFSADGNEVLSKLEHVRVYGEFIIIQKHGKYSILNKSLDTLLTSVFDHIDPLHGYHTRLLVHKDRKYGILGPDLNYVVPCIYEEIHYSNPGFYCVVQNHKLGIINDDGCIIANCEYDYTGPVYSYEGIYCLRKENKVLDSIYSSWEYVYINSKGIRISNKMYTDGRPFENGKAVVFTETHRGWIDTDGVEHDMKPRHQVRRTDDELCSDYDQQIHEELIQAGLRDAFGLSSEDSVPDDFAPWLG